MCRTSLFFHALPVHDQNTCNVSIEHIRLIRINRKYRRYHSEIQIENRIDRPRTECNSTQKMKITCQHTFYIVISQLAYLHADVDDSDLKINKKTSWRFFAVKKGCFCLNENKNRL